MNYITVIPMITVKKQSLPNDGFYSKATKVSVLTEAFRKEVHMYRKKTLPSSMVRTKRSVVSRDFWKDGIRPVRLG